MINLPVLEDTLATRKLALSFMTTPFQEAFDKMPPEIHRMTEIDLEGHFDRTPLDWALRRRLWDMVAISEATGKKISITDWTEGVSSRQYIYDRLCDDPYRLSWIFTPLSTFKTQYEELFSVQFNQMRKFLLKTAVDENNFFARMKLLENLANRVLGPVPKNINLRSQQVPSGTGGGDSGTRAVDQLEQELKTIQATQSTKVIDVKPSGE